MTLMTLAVSMQFYLYSWLRRLLSIPCELPNTAVANQISAVAISLFPTSIDLDRFLTKDRDLDRFRSSYRAGRSVVLNRLLQAGRARRAIAG